NRPIDLLLDREVLSVQVNKGDFHDGGRRTEIRGRKSEVRSQKSAVTGQTSEGKKKDCLPYFRAWLRSRDIPHSILHDLVSPNNRTHRRNLANCQSHHSLCRHP